MCTKKHAYALVFTSRFEIHIDSLHVAPNPNDIWVILSFFYASVLYHAKQCQDMLRKDWNLNTGSKLKNTNVCQYAYVFNQHVNQHPHRMSIITCINRIVLCT